MSEETGNAPQPHGLAAIVGAHPLASRIALLVAALGAWAVAYVGLLPMSEWLVYDLIGLARESHLSESLAFFVFEVPKVLLLLALVIYGVGVIRTFFTPERTRRLLAGRRQVVGNVFAAGLGVVTPFCSCSAVPLFIGFVEAGVPLGVTLSFLIAAPMVNEVAAVLLFGMVGPKVALTYIGLGLGVAIVSGWVIGRLKMEGHVEDWVWEVQGAGDNEAEGGMTLVERLDAGWASLKEIMKKVSLYVVIAVGVGAGIHGYVPDNWLAGIMGEAAWWSVPVAVMLGVPMYSNAAGVVPIIQALTEKGASLGTALAFMMSVIALSLPEAIILRKVLKPRLIVTFMAIVAAGIVLVGYLFNAIW